MQIEYMQCGHEGQGWKFVVPQELKVEQIERITGELKNLWGIKEVRPGCTHDSTSFTVYAWRRNWLYRRLKIAGSIAIASCLGVPIVDLIEYRYRNNVIKRTRLQRDFFGNYNVENNRSRDLVAA